MTIRPATYDDLPALQAMAHAFVHQQSPYADLFADTPDDVLVAFILAVMDNPTGIVLVSETDRLTGMIGLLAFIHPMNGHPTTSELFWWADVPGHGVRLLKAAQAWARLQGSTLMQMVSPSPRVSRLYERLGFAAQETTFSRSL